MGAIVKELIWNPWFMGTRLWISFTSVWPSPQDITAADPLPCSCSADLVSWLVPLWRCAAVAVDLMKEGSTVNLRNAKIDMFKGSMRLAVDKWGRIEPTTPATFKVKEDNNLSLVEYELVNVVDE